MSHDKTQTGPFSVIEIVRERCADLGWPLWSFDEDRTLVHEPIGSEACEGFFRSKAFRSLVLDAVKGFDDTSDYGVTEVFDGAWLVVLPIIERRRLAGITVVFLASESALGNRGFKKLASKAGVDECALRDELMPSATHTRASLDNTAKMILWSTSDLRSLNQKNDLVREFSQQLSNTFEEISLFYTLGQSMNELAHPEKFVNVACDELHGALMYGWVAAAFIDDQFLIRSMSGKLTTSGNIPCEIDEFKYGVHGILRGLSLDHPSVLKPEEAGTLGADGMQVLVRPVIYENTVVGVLLAGGKSGRDGSVSTVDIKIFDAAAGHISVLLNNAILFEDQQLMFLGTLEALSASIDAKDPYTCGHSERVAMLSAEIALASGMSEAEAERIRIGGLVHDVGKIGVPESTLCKAGRLTDAEFGHIKLHPQIGHDILKDIPQFADVLPGVLYHHERYDGRGYPAGLKGQEIPLIARIIGLADSFDAMSSTRTYRAAMDREAVIREIIECSGTQFDPDLTEAFLSIDLKVYDGLVERHQEQSVRGGLRTSRGRDAA